MRETPLLNKEIYHIYNRGVDKRLIFGDSYDIDRFITSMQVFNTIEPIGSIYANGFSQNLQLRFPTPKLVEFITYAVNPNHYHFSLEQQVDNGISEFMKRLGGGYTNYFNEKYERSGALFQGRFKSVHVSSNEYLLHLSAYINLNYVVHSYKGTDLLFCRSSWGEYGGNAKIELCKKDIVLNQYENCQKYQEYALNSLDAIIEQRIKSKEYARILIE